MKTLLFCFLFLSSPAFAATDFFNLKNPEYIRSDLWGPLASFVLPGTGQWMEGQVGSAAVYSSLALSGFGLSIQSSRVKDYDSLTNPSNEFRKALIGDALFKVGAGLSAYHDFRTAVVSRRPIGQYLFLDPEKAETPAELAMAPFKLSYLARPTTYIPLLTLIFGEIIAKKNSTWDASDVSLSDVGMTAGISYGAGVGEEAIFRGYLLPYTHQQLNSKFWLSNSTQAILFGAAHISPLNPVPWIQTLIGAYLGWIS